MKWLFILLTTLLISCDQYETLLDTPMIPFGSKSVLVKEPIDNVKDILMSNGLSIYNTETGYNTGVFKLKHVGYVKYELKEYSKEYTRIDVLYDNINYKNLKKLIYKNDSTFKSFNYLLDMLGDDKILYYQE